jgi:UV DNA damage endonuclease
MKIGYACINMSLADKKITTNRGMIRKTFDAKGIKYASELALQNIRDLVEVVKWNHQNDIEFYRMSSDIFPWMSEYEFSDLPDIGKIRTLLTGLGSLVKKYNHRLTFHPGPFNVLASPNPEVVRKTIVELNKHSQIMDMIGLPASPFAKINIHVGGVYGNKQEALQRFCDNFLLLDENTKKRLTVENDDKPNSYNIQDLMFIHKTIGIPIVFDYHHHMCYNDGVPTEESLLLALSTWPKDITPIVHISEPRDDKNIRAHHDYIENKVNTYNQNVDLMFESKQKELSVLKYREKFEFISIP